MVKPSATVDLPCFPWYWSEDVRIACPPGVGCFVAGEEYNHGGLSVQECVVPQYSIRPGRAEPLSAKLETWKWSGLRCRIKILGDSAGCRVDLRDRPGDPTSSIATAKAVGQDGTAALLVSEKHDGRMGSATTLVLLDAGGNVIDKAAVTVGG